MNLRDVLKRYLSLIIIAPLFSSLSSTVLPARVSATTASTTTTLLSLSNLPAGTTEATYTYCTFGATEFKMDFYRPTGWGPVPVVLQVHGGAWIMGQRTNYVTPAQVSAFLNKGIAFAAIDYQLWNGRSASNDVACAVRYLRASTTRLGLNGRIGALGQSAGGQLVSLLGTTDKSAGFDIGQYPYQSSRVQAVVDEWGPVIFDNTMLTNLPYTPQVFGSSDLSVLKQYSPLTYLSIDDPPFLIVQGAQDTTVPPYQSKNFTTALKNSGIPAQLIMVQNASHYLTPIDSSLPISPTLTQIRTSIVSFFVAHLRN